MDAEFIQELFNLDLDDEELQLCEHLELEYLCPICSLVNYDIFDFSQYRSEPNIKESNVTVNIVINSRRCKNHNRQLSKCSICNPKCVCPHGLVKYNCNLGCRCPHNRLKTSCGICNGFGYGVLVNFK